MQDMNPGSVVKDIALPLYNAKFWMKLIGVVMIIYGAIVALTIVGIVVAWLPIWIGVLLFQAATAAEAAYSQGDQEAAIRATDKLKVYFIINGVMMLIGIILAVAAFFMGGMAALMSMGMGGAGG
ncbi:MAG TPA: DUF5362 family protein [Gammaproteobacteria bacterium]